MDRFFRGLLAGLAGGIIMNVWSFFAYYIINISNRRYLDWSSVILYGHLPRTMSEEVYALMLQIIWVSLLGVVFALLIRDISTSQGLLIKGAFFGLVSGYVIYSIPVMFGIQYLEFNPLKTVISNHIGGIMWGLVMAYVLKVLDARYKLQGR